MRKIVKRMTDACVFLMAMLSAGICLGMGFFLWHGAVCEVFLIRLAGDIGDGRRCRWINGF